MENSRGFPILLVDLELEIFLGISYSRNENDRLIIVVAASTGWLLFQSIDSRCLSKRRYASHISFVLFSVN